MSSLPSDERRALLELARRAIVEAVNHGRLAELPARAGVLGRRAGAFVSLHERGRLRGCIGVIEPTEPLAETIAQCAIAAALEDPRFPPVRPAEIPGLEIEISILSPLEPTQPEEIEVGRHGLVVSRGRLRGLLLPQVAVQFRWTRERFLEETCLKAGLEREAWKDAGTHVHRFTAEVFSEAEFRSEHSERRVQAS